MRRMLLSSLTERKQMTTATKADPIVYFILILYKVCIKIKLNTLENTII